MEATLLTLGVILIVVGLIGKVKAQEIEVGTKNPLVRLILGFIGIVFVLIALSKSINIPGVTPTGSPTPVIQSTTIVPPTNTSLPPTLTSLPPTPAMTATPTASPSPTPLPPTMLPSSTPHPPTITPFPTLSFRIVEVFLRADPFDYTGPCPVKITFSGRISVVGGRGQVSYRFIRSDGANGPVETLIFDSPGSQNVSDTWTLGGPSLPTFSGWESIETFSPQEMKSEQATFKLKCK